MNRQTDQWNRKKTLEKVNKFDYIKVKISSMEKIP